MGDINAKLAMSFHSKRSTKKPSCEKHPQNLAAVIVGKPLAAKIVRLAGIAIGCALSTNFVGIFSEG